MNLLQYIHKIIQFLSKFKLALHACLLGSWSEFHEKYIMFCEAANRRLQNMLLVF